MIEIRNYLCSNVNLFAYHIDSMIIKLYSGLPAAASSTSHTNAASETRIPYPSSLPSLATSGEAHPQKPMRPFLAVFMLETTEAISSNPDLANLVSEN